VAPAPERAVERRPAPTFSVIMAAYQAAETIGEAVASALDQTAPPVEVIVCDDGSTDDLEGALAPHRERIVLLRQGRGGAGSARNRALRAASGEFVAPLDGDDAFLPRRLEALGELAAARPDLDLLSTDVLLERDGEVVGRFYDENRFEVDDQRSAIFGGCFVGWPAARRDRLLAVGGFDESLAIAYDWAAWMRLILAGARAGLVPEPLLLYRLRPGSLSADRARSLRERVELLDGTAAGASLRAPERAALRSARRRAAARAAAEEAREALLESRHDARRRALALAGTRGAAPGARALGAGAALMPRAAGRMLRRRRRAGHAGDDRAPSRGV
jgi:hypothetical protein